MRRAEQGTVHIVANSRFIEPSFQSLEGLRMERHTPLFAPLAVNFKDFVATDAL
jgi:hypothetical protein